MKKLRSVLVGLLAIIMCLGLRSCGSDSNGKKEYIKPEEIQKVYANPKEYKGKYIKVSGRIFSDVEQNGDEYVFQMFQDVKNSKNNTLVTTKDQVSEDEYVIVEGRIKGEVSGTNALGGNVTGLALEDAKVTKAEPDKVFDPAVKTVEVGETKSEHGIDFTLEKLEFGKKETRAYVKVKNGSNSEFNLWSYDCKAIQNGKQNDINDDSCYDYQKVSDDLSCGTESSGIVVFPKMDDGTPITLIFKCGVDDYDVEIDNFTFEVNPK